MVNETCYQSLSLSLFPLVHILHVNYHPPLVFAWNSFDMENSLHMEMFGSGQVWINRNFLKRNNVFKSKAPWKFEKKIGNLSGNGLKEK